MILPIYIAFAGKLAAEQGIKALGAGCAAPLVQRRAARNGAGRLSGRALMSHEERVNGFDIDMVSGAHCESLPWAGGLSVLAPFD